MEGIRRFFVDALTSIIHPYNPVEPDFDVTFGKTDFDFVDIYVEPKKIKDNPQDIYDFCNRPMVLSADNPQTDESNQTPPTSFCIKEQYVASM